MITLNGITLKQPSSIIRTNMEISRDHTTLSGIVKRDIVRHKEAWTITFSMLTTTQINQLIGLYELKTNLTLVISELSINANVWMKIQSRVFEARGTDFRETIVVYFEEV